MHQKIVRPGIYCPQPHLLSGAVYAGRYQIYVGVCNKGQKSAGQRVLLIIMQSVHLLSSVTTMMSMNHKSYKNNDDGDDDDDDDGDSFDDDHVSEYTSTCPMKYHDHI